MSIGSSETAKNCSQKEKMHWRKWRSWRYRQYRQYRHANFY